MKNASTMTASGQMPLANTVTVIQMAAPSVAPIMRRFSSSRTALSRPRLRTGAELDDRRPGAGVQGLLPAEREAILALAETWGGVDRSHRKLAHRGSRLAPVPPPRTMRSTHWHPARSG